MKSLPDNISAYKKTKIFDEFSIPSALLKDHNTLKGVWGKVKVLEGQLLYIIQTTPVEKVSLSCLNTGVVEPEVLHHIKPIGKVKFYVEFYK